MRKVLLLGLAVALVSGAAYANFCARDYVPASTLLVPYAVVDMTQIGTTWVPDVNGYTTLLAVTNVSNTKQLIHVVVWDALSNHVVDFDEVLTGYDVWTVNMRDLLNGTWAAFDTQKTPFSPAPPAPQPFGPTTNVPFTTTWGTPQLQNAAVPPNTNCAFPYTNGVAAYSQIIIGKLMGAIVANNNGTQAPCSGNTFQSPGYLPGLTGAPVFFYLTIDVVQACNQNFPTDEGYWDGCTAAANCPYAPGITSYPIPNNVIIGDVIYLNSHSNFSESIPAVSIEGDLDWAATTSLTTGFYSRYTNLYELRDWHEPLPTAFGFRYINMSGVSTNLRVWEGGDSTPYFDATTGDVIACHPYIYYAFDENENSVLRGGPGPSGFNVVEPNMLPFETQSAPVDVANFDGVSANNGWMALIFDPSNPSMTFDKTIQAWAGVQYTFAGYSTAIEAATLGNYFCFGDPNSPLTNVTFSDVLPSLNTYFGALDAYYKR